MARWYRPLEFAAFGRDLERARFAHLGRLAAMSEILILGEGDGRCAVRLASLAPGARIVCVDSSPAMIDRAARRARASGVGDRLTFTCADVRSYSARPGRFDAVATLFVLDCFRADEVSSIVSRVGGALKPGALWLFADFSQPAAGFARARARVWLSFLYAFFRWETGLSVSVLPPSEAILEHAGWRRSACLELQGGMIRSAVYRAPVVH
jgi:cyclopropane fatty-acyl-phospholipid synthase-like methyltransferase